MKAKAPEHQEASACSLNHPESQGRGNAVCRSIDTGQYASHQLAHAEVLLQNDREVVVQSVDAAHLLHELSSHAEKHSNEMIRAISEPYNFLERDLRASLNLQSTSD